MRFTGPGQNPGQRVLMMDDEKGSSILFNVLIYFKR